MTFPTPNDANIPLIEGLDPSWNAVVQHIPEDKRSEVAPTLKEWHQNYDTTRQQAEQWGNFSKSGIDPQRAEMAISVLDAIENQPQMVYETLQNHLGLTPQQARQVMEEHTPGSTTTPPNSNDDGAQKLDLTSHPEYQTMRKQLDTLAQIALAQKQEAEQNETNKKAEETITSELEALKTKHGDFPEKEIVMRMIHMNMSGEEALADFNAFADELRAARKPAPYVLGGGGPVPRESINVKTLDRKNTKSLVAQMLANAATER